MKYKLAVRAVFSVLIETDEDLFLFLKYSTLIAAAQNHKYFSRTIRKALRDWYRRIPEERLCSMWVAHRGLHGYTHKSIMKLCHLNDDIIGSSQMASPFFKSCTKLVAETEKADPLTGTFVTARHGHHGQEVLQIPTCFIMAISKLRTTNNPEEALKIIKQFELSYKSIPGKFFRHSKILETVVPTMPYSLILRYWRRIVQYHNTEENKKLLAICQQLLTKIDLIENHRIHPVHILMELRTSPKKPFKSYSGGKFPKMQMASLNKLYMESFNWSAESGNLRMLITVNLQTGYKKKFLKNHKRISFFDATFALAFGYLKREAHVDIYNFVEHKLQLEKVPLTKDCTAEAGLRIMQSIDKKKSSQRLATILSYALISEQVYDVFLCIVPKAGRSNPKKKSKYLANVLSKYRQHKNPNARFIILSLLKIKPRSMKYSSNHVEHILEICGLDEHTTDLVNNFATRRFD